MRSSRTSFNLVKDILESCQTPHITTCQQRFRRVILKLICRQYWLYFRKTPNKSSSIFREKESLSAGYIFTNLSLKVSCLSYNVSKCELFNLFLLLSVLNGELLRRLKRLYFYLYYKSWTFTTSENIGRNITMSRK